MRLSKILLEALNGPLRKWANTPIIDLVAGKKYSIVLLSGGWCGIAYSPPPQKSQYRISGYVTLRELARAADRDAILRSLALAGLNAVTSLWIYYTSGLKIIAETRLTKFIEDKCDKRGEALLVGFMKSTAEELRKLGFKVWVLEADRELRRSALEKGFPVITSPTEIVNNVDVVVVSGSSLILDPENTVNYFNQASSACIKSLVGPSSSFHPLIAKRLGVTLLGGIFIHPSLCWRIRSLVAQGYGYRSLSRAGKIVKWFMEIES
ncbi:MAG: DUF364 domain-containing protein [Pyrodictiaceae archaeon]